MISESQERMCAAVHPERWADVREVCARWGIPVAIIGRVTADGDIVVIEGGLDADGRRARLVAGTRPHPGPRADERRDRPRPDRRPRRRIIARRRPPAHRGGRRSPAGARDGSRRGPPRPARVGEPLVAASPSSTSTTRRSGRTPSPDPGAARPSCGSRARPRRSWRRRTATRPSASADPWLGAALSVAEATRNVSITGARPLGVTNCLNYGDPTRPEAFWQLTEGVRGLADACRALGLPVTGGNVSLYNESPTGAIAPTPEIGVVGLLDDIATLVGPAFQTPLDAILLVGDPTPGLAGSAYAALAGAAAEDDPPGLDLAREAALQAFIREAIARGLVASAQDVSGGGLAVALAECAMWGGLGASVRIAGRALAGRRPVRREPVAARPQLPAALRRGARAARPPARPAGRDDRLGRRRPAGDRAGGIRRDRRRRGTGQPDRRRPRGAAGGPAPHLGARAVPGPRLGGLTDVRRLRRGPARRRGDGRGLDRGARAVRPPASRPGIGRAGGQRRRAADALQGPRDDQHGPRRAPPAEPPRRPRDRPLPLFDDRFHDLGERPADVPARSAPGPRHRPQRQPRQHPRPADPARGRPRAPAGLDRHGAPDRAAGRRAGGRHRRGAAAGPATGPRRVQPGHPRRAAGHRRPRSVRLPAAGPRPAAAHGRTRRPDDGLWRGDDATAGWCLSSETAGLDIVGAEYVRDVEPGEIVILERGQAPRSVRFAEATPALCVFELIYFARPDSYMEGRNLYEARRQMGMQLALEHPVEADLVMPVPDTGAPAAAGFAEASGIPYREGMYRNRYAGRTFIQPSQGCATAASRSSSTRCARS